MDTLYEDLFALLCRVGNPLFEGTRKYPAGEFTERSQRSMLSYGKSAEIIQVSY